MIRIMISVPPCRPILQNLGLGEESERERKKSRWKRYGAEG